MHSTPSLHRAREDFSIRTTATAYSAAHEWVFLLILIRFLSLWTSHYRCGVLTQFSIYFFFQLNYSSIVTCRRASAPGGLFLSRAGGSLDIDFHYSIFFSICLTQSSVSACSIYEPLHQRPTLPYNHTADVLRFTTQICKSHSRRSLESGGAVGQWWEPCLKAISSPLLSSVLATLPLHVPRRQTKHGEFWE